MKYAGERAAFGRPIGRYRAIEFKIARMEARAHAARTAYYDAAALMLAGKPFKKEAAIAKLVASEAAMDNARDATQIHGGYGFMNEYSVARHYRDSKILEIGEGTTRSAIDADRPGIGRRMSADKVVEQRGLWFEEFNWACATCTGPAAPSPRPTTCCSPR